MSLRELFHRHVKSLGEPGRQGARGGEAHRSLHPSWPAGTPSLGMRPCWSTQPQPSQPRAEQRCRQPVDSLRDICAFKPVSLVCCCLVAQSCPTLLRPYGLYPAGLLCPQDFPGKNTGVNCRFLLHGIFPTKGSNLHLLHCRWIFFSFFLSFFFSLLSSF